MLELVLLSLSSSWALSAPLTRFRRSSLPIIEGLRFRGAGDPSEPASLSTAVRCPLRGLTVAIHTLPIRNFRGRGRLWESVSFAVLCPQNSLAANNCHLWTFFYSSHPMLLRFNRKSEIYNKQTRAGAGRRRACRRRSSSLPLSHKYHQTLYLFDNYEIGRASCRERV